MWIRIIALLALLATSGCFDSDECPECEDDTGTGSETGDDE